jgi:hypothetical protein
MTNIDKNCKVIDAQHSHLEPSIGYAEPDVDVLLYGLFMIYSEMENHSEFICASNSKDKLKLDLNSLKIEGTSQINKILVKDSKNSKILNITNANSDIFMDFSKNVNIELKDLKTTIKYDKFLTINVNDISKIYNYSDILKQNSINSGNISLKIINKDNIDFNGFFSGFTIPIKKDNKEINSLDFYGNINKDRVQISSSDNSIRLNFKDNIDLFLDGYDIYYDENISKNSKLEFDTNIDLKNSKLFFDNQEYKIKSANFNIKKD